MILICASLYKWQDIIITTRDTHSFCRFGYIFFPATEVPEAESFKAEFDASFIMDQFTHFILVISDRFQVSICGVDTNTRSLTDPLDHIQCRVAVATFASRAPRFVG